MYMYVYVGGREGGGVCRDQNQNQIGGKVGKLTYMYIR